MRIPHAALNAVPTKQVDELARVMFTARYDREPRDAPQSYDELLVREFRALARHMLAWLCLEGRIEFADSPSSSDSDSGGEPPSAAGDPRVITRREGLEGFEGFDDGA